MTKRADKMGPRDYSSLKKLVEDMKESDKRMMDAFRRKRSELIVNTLVRVIGGHPDCHHPYGTIGVIIGIEDNKTCRLYRVLANNYDYWYFDDDLEVIKVGAIIK